VDCSRELDARQSATNQRVRAMYHRKFDFDSVERDGEDAAVAANHSDDVPVRGACGAEFVGKLAALVWVVGAICLAYARVGVAELLALDLAVQAELTALGLAPALLLWVAAAAAGEASQARQHAVELTRLAREARSPSELGMRQARGLSNSVTTEIEALNETVADALDRMSDLEAAAQRNAAMFGQSLMVSHENAEAIAGALGHEHRKLAELNDEMRAQADGLSSAIDKQARMMREASDRMRAEIAAAEDALDTQTAALAASARAMGSRTVEFQRAAASLNSSMGGMLDGLGEATRLSDAARQSAEQAVFAANDTARAVRETTRGAVSEAKRAAESIRAEAAAPQARDKSAKRLGARASGSGPKSSAAAAPRVANDFAEPNDLRAAASAARARSSPAQGTIEIRQSSTPKPGRWGNFFAQTRADEMPTTANEDDFDLLEFESPPAVAIAPHRYRISEAPKLLKQAPR
jgi:hypothetical protein